MNWKLLGLVFGTGFLANSGERTQHATILFAAAEQVSKWLALIGASAALVATSALGVLGGARISQCILEPTLHTIAGVVSSLSVPAWAL